MSTNRKIKETFSEWIAFSGTRSGAPLKSRKDVYPLIRLPDYNSILDGNKSISAKEFNEWHKRNSEKIKSTRPKMTIGWATKLINLYLKSMVFLGGFGRKGLIDHIHPPIDGGLWKGIKEKYKDEKSVIKLTHSTSRIKNIETYSDYEKIIQGFHLICQKENIKLIEIEKYWKGTES